MLSLHFLSIYIIIITGAAGIIISSLLLRPTMERMKVPGLVNK
jgi:hypothetical protein